MKQCLACRGLVPERLSHCPNCAVSPRRVGTLAAGTALIGLLASGCGVAMPVYGAPCTSKLPDGGSVCTGARAGQELQAAEPADDADGR